MLFRDIYKYGLDESTAFFIFTEQRMGFLKDNFLLHFFQITYEKREIYVGYLRILTAKAVERSGKDC